MSKMIYLFPLIISIVAVPCLAFSNVKYERNSFMTNLATTEIGTTKLNAFRFGDPATSEANVETMEESTFSNEVENTLIEPITDVSITALRVLTCALMIHHGIDKIDNVQGFSTNVVAKFFGFLPGDPSFWTLSAAATQVAGSGLLTIGFLSRPVALSMSMTMITAVVFHLLNTGIEGFPLGVVPQHS
jgi:uncharacterized membrane protein YphA (DoxX/SURF4 family)